MKLFHALFSLIFVLILIFGVQTQTYETNLIEVSDDNWQNDSFASRATFEYNGNNSIYSGYFFDSYYTNYALYEGKCQDANRVINGTVFVQNKTLTLSVNESVSQVCIYYRDQRTHLTQVNTFFGLDVTSIGVVLL